MTPMLDSILEAYKMIEKMAGVVIDRSVESLVHIECGDGALLASLWVRFPKIQYYGIDHRAICLDVAEQILPNAKFKNCTLDDLDGRWDGSDVFSIIIAPLNAINDKKQAIFLRDHCRKLILYSYGGIVPIDSTFFKVFEAAGFTHYPPDNNWKLIISDISPRANVAVLERW